MRVACICTGNTCRSPMLSVLLEQALIAHEVADVAVLSAGVAAAPGQPASQHAIAAMAERGLDLSQHRSTPLAQLDLAGISQFFCLTPAHAQAVVAAGVPSERITILAAADGGVPDPFGGSAKDYEDCACVLEFEADRLARELARGG